MTGTAIVGQRPPVAPSGRRLRRVGLRNGVTAATLPAVLWLLVLTVNDGAGRPVLTILVAVGLILVGAVIGWVWGPRCDARSGWRTATLVAWVAFTAAILVALVVSVAAVAQRLTDAGLSPDQVRAAPSNCSGPGSSC